MSGKPITQLQALNLYGSFRLSSIIKRLRDRGMNIKTELKGAENYAEYSLTPKEDLFCAQI